MILAIGGIDKSNPIHKFIIHIYHICYLYFQRYRGKLRWMRSIGVVRSLSGRFAALGFAARDIVGL